jgi:hypothetical protein
VKGDGLGVRGHDGREEQGPRLRGCDPWSRAGPPQGSGNRIYEARIHSRKGRESSCGGTTEGKSRGPACGDATPGGVQGLHEEEVTEFTRCVFIRGKVASLLWRPRSEVASAEGITQLSGFLFFSASFASTAVRAHDGREEQGPRLWGCDPWRRAGPPRRKSNRVDEMCIHSRRGRESFVEAEA